MCVTGEAHMHQGHDMQWHNETASHPQRRSTLVTEPQAHYGRFYSWYGGNLRRGHRSGS